MPSKQRSHPEQRRIPAKGAADATGKVEGGASDALLRNRGADNAGDADSNQHTDIAAEATGYTDNYPLGEGTGQEVPVRDESSNRGLLDRLKGALGLGDDMEPEERGSGAAPVGSQSGTRSDPKSEPGVGSDGGRNKAG